MNSQMKEGKIAWPDPYVYKNVAPWNLKNLKYIWKPGTGIYPNPAGDYLHFSQPTDILSLVIFDLTGQVVKGVPFSRTAD